MRHWVFVHDMDAMTAKVDANYLYFGWWLMKDEDGVPTSASAFTGTVGTFEALDANPSSLSGSATYAGQAAGKFAISGTTDGAGDAGHFTAAAMLAATFGTRTHGPNFGGVSGTLDNFMANDESVPWSVSLLRATWNGVILLASLLRHGLLITTPITTVDESMTSTVWSIDGNSAARVGQLGAAMMYDELPGTVADGGDGSDVPTSVTGTFQSRFGTTHTMVGAFGAERE